MTNLSNVTITKLLRKRKVAAGIKKASMTRKLRKLAKSLCNSFRGTKVENCRGCRIQAALT